MITKIKTIAGVSSMLVAGTLSVQGADQPNIIFMLADDLGYGDLSSYNPNAEGVAPLNTPINTPNLDRLAKGGAMMTDFHSAAPICSPSRRALLTARYPNRLGEWAEAYRGAPDGVVAKDDPTIGMWLKEAGYATACYGKWNIGEVKGVSWPGAHGFDDWLIIDHNTGYFDHTNANKQSKGREMLFGTGGEHITNLKGTYLTDIWTDKALEFIDQNESKPFFIYMPFAVPHSPLQDPHKGSVKYDAEPKKKSAEARAAYVSMVEYMDSRIGKIFKSLDDKGLMENTLIIFTSDNGGMISGNCWPLKKSKQYLEEGGTRVPYLMQWPKVIPAGTVSEQSSIMMDASVTVLEAAGARKFVPADRTLDGINLLPVLTGKADLDSSRTFGWRRRDWGWQGNYLRQEAYRSGNWKLVRTYEFLGKSKWSAEYKDQVFNLKDDIAETKNLANSMPEKYEELKKGFETWKAETVEQNPAYLLDKRDQLGSPVKFRENPVIFDFKRGKVNGRFMTKGNEERVSEKKFTNGIFSVTLEGGMKGTSPLLYQDRNLVGTSYTQMVVKMKVTPEPGATTGSARALLRQKEWKGKDIPFAVKTDGQWHEYTIDVTKSPAWSQWTEAGRIGLVLPLVKKGKINIAVDYVKLK